MWRTRGGSAYNSVQSRTGPQDSGLGTQHVGYRVSEGERARARMATASWAVSRIWADASSHTGLSSVCGVVLLSRHSQEFPPSKPEERADRWPPERLSA